jgi:L-ascorbate metabolism protein UlaG (beta-lactamase superfamily)
MSAVGYVGHGTVRIELDGAALLTDPLLGRYVGHLRRPSPVQTGVAEGLAAVLISHGHRDHLDVRSLKRIDRGVPVVVPRGLGGLLVRQGFANVIEVVDGDEISLGAVRVRATHAEHDSRRRPGRLRGQPVGYAVLGSKNVYFAGDTGPFEAMDALVPDLHLALLPIWGWGPTLGRGQHLDPESAAQALRFLRPKVAVPIHWGTYLPAHRGLRSLPGYLVDPAEAFVREAAAAAPEVDVQVLRPGERLAF